MSYLDIHKPEEDEEEKLLNLRPFVLHLKQSRERDTDDHKAGDDIDSVPAETELRQIDASPRCL